jgi:RNA polymerase sigma factor (sigma-70 family)
MLRRDNRYLLFLNHRTTALNLEELYNAYKNMVYNLALHYVQNVEDAEEITQDVFVAVHQSIDSFEQRAAVSTWMYRITINKSLDFIRSRKRKKRFAFVTALFGDDGRENVQLHSEFNHPGVALEQKEALHHIFSCINDLPDSQKTALILMKIEGRSQQETAEIMNTTAKAVESLVQRAKTGLAKKLATAEGNNYKQR